MCDSTPFGSHILPRQPICLAAPCFFGAEKRAAASTPPLSDRHQFPTGEIAERESGKVNAAIRRRLDTGALCEILALAGAPRNVPTA
jgi:hypothetical protein